LLFRARLLYCIHSFFAKKTPRSDRRQHLSTTAGNNHAALQFIYINLAYEFGSDARNRALA
jgi:hypothetical protein